MYVRLYIEAFLMQISVYSPNIAINVRLETH